MRAARIVLVGLAVVLVASACGGSGETASTESTAAEPSASFAEAVAGPHRYFVTHENLSLCTGAAEDGEESLEITFRPGSLTLTAEGFVLYSETNDPTMVEEGSGLQPCFRYTYTRLD